MKKEREARRERAIREHEAVRGDLARLEASADRFRREGLHLLGPLREQAESVVATLRRHMAWEEALQPSHGAAGAHRDREDERRAHAHREQCELLDALVDDLRDGSRPPGIIAAHVAAVAGLLLRDFLEEERALTRASRPGAGVPAPGKSLHR